MGTPRRRGALAALACAALLGGCGGGSGRSSDASSGSSPSSGPASSSPEPEDAGTGAAGGLADGLLPAEAFGAEATVVRAVPGAGAGGGARRGPGGPDHHAGAARNCPRRGISSPQLGQAALTFEALVRLVQDGDRVITLLTIMTDGSRLDATAVASLLEQAFEVQAEALG